MIQAETTPINQTDPHRDVVLLGGEGVLNFTVEIKIKKIKILQQQARNKQQQRQRNQSCRRDRSITTVHQKGP